MFNLNPVLFKSTLNLGLNVFIFSHAFCRRGFNLGLGQVSILNQLLQKVFQSFASTLACGAKWAFRALSSK